MADLEEICSTIEKVPGESVFSKIYISSVLTEFLYLLLTVSTEMLYANENASTVHHEANHLASNATCRTPSGCP